MVKRVKLLSCVNLKVGGYGNEFLIYIDLTLSRHGDLAGLILPTLFLLQTPDSRAQPDQRNKHE